MKSEIKNKFIHHLMNFGEEIKTNAKMRVINQHQDSYVMEDGDYDYSFIKLRFKTHLIYSIKVVLNIDRKEKTFLPILAIHFTEDGRIYCQDAKEIKQELIRRGFEQTGEKYYGDLQS